MFNGIITHLGKLETMKKNCYFFSTEKSFLKKIKKGASVAIDGICLTVIAKEKNTFSVEVMPETLRRTMLVELKIGDYVNLEHSVSANTPLDGHLVYGHIDGTAEISSIKKEDNSWIFKFKVPEKISKYLIEKGAIAVNGISLTIIEPEKDFFTVSKNWELMHYNGNDLKVLYKPTTIFDVLLFEKDIYLLCHENTPFIVHGKLKEEQE